MKFLCAYYALKILFYFKCNLIIPLVSLCFMGYNKVVHFVYELLQSVVHSNALKFC